MGDSIAQWDGDTLVVETHSINAIQRVVGGTFLSKDWQDHRTLHAHHDSQILYAFEINDPTVYASVWRGEMPLNQAEDKVYEYACHEGNYGLVRTSFEGGRENDRHGIAADRRTRAAGSSSAAPQLRVLGREHGAHHVRRWRALPPASPHSTWLRSRVEEIAAIDVQPGR